MKRNTLQTRTGTFRPYYGSANSTAQGELENQEFSIGNVYPNPFMSVGTLRFCLVHAGYVTLRLYDLKGSPALALADKQMEAGEHKICISKEDLGLESGDYVCQFSLESVYGSFQKCRLLSIQ